MKVFLTGASGFIGSHLLDLLRASRHEVSILLRPTSSTRFILRHLQEVTVHYGSLDDSRMLRTAMSGTEVVIHCAGKTKALHSAEFYRVNQRGTLNVVEAANGCRDSLRHLVYISSLAVSGPAVVGRPAEETDFPRPVSTYGHSKLLGETAVRQFCRVPWTILRPAAVYGPRDSDFLPVFQQVKHRLMPLLCGAGRPLNLVYGLDVASAVVCCLMKEQAIGKTYHIAAEPPCSDEELMQEIARQLGLRPLRLRIPRSILSSACLIQETLSRVTGRPNILSRQKLPELLAPGWVCSTEEIRKDLGYTALTPLREGVARTLEWYRMEEWV
jgi:nucleoside-diphosphate-sugar epimerase